MKYRVQIIIAIFLFNLPTIYSQVRSESLKYQAQLLMKEGRYKEAIDQLNKYVTANPREPEGYHLRGLCFEKTTEYQYSVLDLRRARSLNPENPQITNDLARVTVVWHKMLYEKIEGYKRNIAIDPNNANNYLEIGKAYRWLEEWSTAEEWYDEYIKRDPNASPDEILRYTEILAKTGSIKKGERILNKYVDRYPDDWRLQSRFGYFSMWLGRFSIAQNAFEISLGIKPFFKEAQDGLDLTKNQSYMRRYQPRSFESVYPIDRYYYILQRSPKRDEIRFNLVEQLIKAKRFEEAYQQLRYLQNKYSEDTRYKTLLERVNDNRDSTLNEKVNAYSDSLKNEPDNKNYALKLAGAYANLYYYDNAIEILEEYLALKPDEPNNDVKFKLAQYNAWNFEWEKAISIINELLEDEPDNLDYQLLRAQIAVWTVLDFDIAEKYLLNIIEKRPKQLDAYISIAAMYCWEKDFPSARKYLDIAEKLSPNSPDVVNAENNYALHLSAYQEELVFKIRKEAEDLSAQGDCQGAVDKFEEYKSKRSALSIAELKEYALFLSCAEEYDKAIEIYTQVLDQGFDFNAAVGRARCYYNTGDSARAVSELEELNNKVPQDPEMRIYLADAYTLVNKLAEAELILRTLRYQSADENYREKLKNIEYYNNSEFQDNLNTFNNPDSIEMIFTPEITEQIEQRMLYLGEAYVKDKQLTKAEQIYNEILETSDNESIKNDLSLRRLGLADAYVLQKDYGKAEDIYDELLVATQDTAEIRLLNQRIDWLPPTGFNRGLSSIGNAFGYLIPTNIGIAPSTTYYEDNQNFSIWNYSLRMDAGLFGFFGVGASWNRSLLKTEYGDKYFTGIKGVGTIYFSRHVTLSGSYGRLNIPGESERYTGDGSFTIQDKDRYSIVLYYENNDARLILYSPTLLYTRLKTELYRFTANYQYKDLLRVSGFYNYYNVSDGNYGNDFQFRFGKKFFDDGLVGYEYYYTDYSFVSTLYYSPQEFSSHSLWAEYNYQVSDELKLKAGGKIGYVPSVDFVISEIFGEFNASPLNFLVINGRLGFSNSFRYGSGYKSVSAMLSAYISVY